MNTIKKIFSMLIIMAIIASMAVSLASCTKYDDQLTIYNWVDYIDSSVLDDFAEYYKEETGRTLKIVYSTFDTNETMITKISKGNADVDLICPSDYAIEKLMRLNLLSKINFDKIPNSVNINGDIKTKVSEIFGEIDVDSKKENMNNYFVPYMWGTLGILYNVDHVTEDDLSAGWGLLWNEKNNPNLTGKILMKDSIRDAYVVGVMYAKQLNKLPEKYKNYSTQQLINTVDSELIDVVEELFNEQRKVLKGYEVDFGKDDMIKEAAYVDLAWSGDALYAIEEAAANGIELDYFIPNNEGNIWFDGWIIPSSSQNKDIAEMFINYLCLPEIGMRNSMEIGYTSALDVNILKGSQEALDVLKDNEYSDADILDFFADESRYPSIIDSDSNLALMKDFGNDNQSIVQMWERVKASDFDYTLIIIIIASIAGVGILALVIFKLKGKGKKRKVA